MYISNRWCAGVGKFSEVKADVAARYTADRVALRSDPHIGNDAITANLVNRPDKAIAERA